MQQAIDQALSTCDLSTDNPAVKLFSRLSNRPAKHDLNDLSLTLITTIEKSKNTPLLLQNTTALRAEKIGVFIVDLLNEVESPPLFSSSMCKCQECSQYTIKL